jgi:hypothetical protein
MSDQQTPMSGSRWEPDPAAPTPSVPAATEGGRLGRVRGALRGRPTSRVGPAVAAVALVLVGGLGGFALGLAADGQAAGTQVATSGSTTGSTTEDDAGTGQDGLPPDPGRGHGGSMPPGHGGGYGPGTRPDDGTTADGAGRVPVPGDTA